MSNLAQKKKTVSVIVANPIVKEYTKRINKGLVANGKVLEKKNAHKGFTELIIGFDDFIDANSMNIGHALNEQKYICAGLMEAEKHKNAKQKNTIELSFDASIRKEFYTMFKDTLGIVSMTASIDGKTTKYEFDTSGIDNRNDLAKLIFKIVDCANTILANRRNARDFQYIESVVEHLNELPDMFTKSYSFTELTGQELIDQGYCTAFDSVGTKAKIFQTFLNILLGRNSKRYDYLFFGKVVERASKYYVLHAPKALEQSKKIDHAQEVILRYKYGEQMYFGRGVKEVEIYYKSVINFFNEQIRAENEGENEQEN